MKGWGVVAPRQGRGSMVEVAGSGRGMQREFPFAPLVGVGAVIVSSNRWNWLSFSTVSIARKKATRSAFSTTM